MYGMVSMRGSDSERCLMPLEKEVVEMQRAGLEVVICIDTYE